MNLEKERYWLYLAEIETGIILNAQGERRLGGEPFRPGFATRESALAAKDELLRRFPFAEVLLVDGVGEREPERFTDEVAFKRYFTAMTAWRRWYSRGWLWRLLTREPLNPRARMLTTARSAVVRCDHAARLRR